MSMNLGGYTLEILDKLTAANMDLPAAKALSEVISDQLAKVLEMSATKEDLAREFSLLRADLTRGLRDDLSRVLKDDIGREFAVFKEAVSKDMALLKANIDRDIAVGQSSIIKWVAGMLVAQVAVILTILKYLPSILK